MQLYAVLRGAIFAESGFNLNLWKITPDGLKRSMNAVFCTLDDAGKTVRIERIVGCEGMQEDMISVPLTPYAYSAKANAALRIICDHLSGALAGDIEAQRTIGAGWSYMLFNCLEPESQNWKIQLAILENAYGAGHVHAKLNPYGTVAGLGFPNESLMFADQLKSTY